MGNTTLYLIVAAVVVVLVILILVIWSMRQLRSASGAQKTRAKKEKQKARKVRKESSADKESPDINESVETETPRAVDESSVVDEPILGTEPASLEDIHDVSREVPQSASLNKELPSEKATETATWMNDVAPEQEPPIVWEDLDALGADFHLNEDHVVHLSAYVAPKVTSDEDMQDEEELHSEEVFMAKEEPMIANDSEPEKAVESSVEGYLEEPLEKHVDERQQWLRKQLDMPSVLGWFSLSPDGMAKYSDQVYDQEVYHHFAKLLEQMIASAELVGMADWKEFVVHGAEGVILMMSAPQSIMAKGDYIVVFLDEEQSVSRVIAQIGQVS